MMTEKLGKTEAFLLYALGRSRNYGVHAWLRSLLHAGRSGMCLQLDGRHVHINVTVVDHCIERS